MLGSGKFKDWENAHVSLSNSACLENNRDTGGRTAYVEQKVNLWLDTPSDIDDVIPLPLKGGEVITLCMGLKPRYTVCPTHLPLL